MPAVLLDLPPELVAKLDQIAAQNRSTKLQRQQERSRLTLPPAVLKQAERVAQRSGERAANDYLKHEHAKLLSAVPPPILKLPTSRRAVAMMLLSQALQPPEPSRHRDKPDRKQRTTKTDTATH